LSVLGLASLVAAAALAADAPPETVVVRPAPIDEVLANPGMGITTFQRFAGQGLNPGKTWSEVGPERRLPDAAAPPDFPPSRVAYLRWFWHQLEPARGRYRWEIVDGALAEARRHGQTLALRVMPYDEKDPLPAWYRQSGALRANRDTDKDGAIWSPDADDPLYRETWTALVAALGRRYDGHPDLDTVDISTVGYWGEGWGPYLPRWEIQQALIDAYLRAFTRTPLLAAFDQLPALRYAVEHGAGWRLDCWGDMGRPGHKFIHMLDLYPQQVVRAGAAEVWRRRPVSLESCGTPLWWQELGWDLPYILEQALRWHASTVNIKSSTIPAAWRPAFEAFQKKLGYRLLLRRMEYPRVVRAGAPLAVKSWWLNAGVAPPYAEHTLAFELRAGTASALLPAPVDVRTWLPGDALFEGSLRVPPTLAAGKYRLRVALLDPRSGKPDILLAIAGRQADGFYDLGEIEIR
jgi:hypothetical protein